MKPEARSQRPQGRAPQSCARFVAIFYLLSSIFLVSLTGCRRDMFLQPSEKPLEHSEFFRDNGMASRPLPAHTVARGQLD